MIPHPGLPIRACSSRSPLRALAAALVLPLALALGPAVPLGAQEQLPAPEPRTAADSLALAARTVMLVGVVRDSAGRPLGGAEVRAGAWHTTLSDADGRFSLMGVPADTVQLLIRRIGFLPADVILAADAGARVELAVSLVPSAVQLGTIVVEGRQLNTLLHQKGFYDRQRQSFGKMFDPEELERSATPLTGFLYQVPGVRIQRGASGTAVALGRAGGRECQLNVYLDGIQLRWASEVGLDNIVNRQDILALEVYPRASLLPSSLGRRGRGSLSSGGLASPTGGAGLSGVDNADCGAIVIWTKPFGST